jgi:2'-5' RNA ligase
MPEKFLCLIATFDEATALQMKELERIINESGIVGTQTPDIPHHITLAYYDLDRKDEVKQLLQSVCETTPGFDLSFNHIGLFGLKVLFLAPDVNEELLGLHRKFDVNSIHEAHGWTAHATLLIDEAENIHRALDLVANNFQQLKARVEGVSLYEIEPTQLIATHKLQ